MCVSRSAGLLAARFLGGTSAAAEVRFTCEHTVETRATHMGDNTHLFLRFILSHAGSRETSPDKKEMEDELRTIDNAFGSHIVLKICRYM
ncbi:hypothetical protein DPMN_108325 [Dreissena polymorpha]|uniref:Uncharacterized protein n=1 Tax=Dreissena polymorpha TaxID=45954 RepID=A0A9D4QLX3_DREPO|nr:hypothetical protein DPMN_108325 [Dreissena polymorpha]